jgi:type IV pilus assembly protein PilQ
MKKKIFILILYFFSYSLYAQNYSSDQLRSIFDSLAIKSKGLNNKVQLNVSSLEVSELINSIGLENNLNIVVEPNLNQLISYNFFDVEVKDVFIYLHSNYDIDIQIIGSIISFKKRVKKEVKIKEPEKKLNIVFNTENQFLSVDLKNDTLSKVFNEITLKSGKNFIISPEIRDKTINGLFQNRPFIQTLEMLCLANNIQIKKQNEDYTISSLELESKKNTETNKSVKKEKSFDDNFRIEINSPTSLNIATVNKEILEIITEAANKLGVHFVLYSNIEGKVTVDLNKIEFEDLLKTLLQGTKYGYLKTNDLYLIGEQKSEGIRKTDLLKIENRTIESVVASIPKDLLTDIDIKEFIELNALILSGTERKINDLTLFIKKIDVVVPMVQIDVMLLYSKKASSNNIGMNAGIKTAPTVTSGQVFPGLDVSMGATTINSILDAINGFGILNLGKVTENFYLSLQALESNSVIKIESTPKISTLNGHEANISIGETTYYQETQVNVQTSVTNQGVLQSRIWKSVDANLTVKIKPFVSADEYVTLEITVNQDDFSGKVDPSSPPNISTQTLESMIRVKNGEVILLGGLEKKKNNDAGSGVPWVSRVPVLKWFFSSRLKENEKSKLHILVRPTVTY